MNHFRFMLLGSLLLSMFFLSSCVSAKNATDKVVSYPIPASEAQWIRDGDPIEFEGEKWVPQDTIELLKDSEVTLLGEYRGVQFFIENVDVRPYNRLYTKFGRNQFRVFLKKETHD